MRDGIKLHYKILITDKLGLAATPSENYLYYKVTFGNDTSLILSPTPWTYNYSDRSNVSKSELHLFTDRSIYRPGQAVFFKGIACEKNTNEIWAVENKTYVISLRDANNKEVANQKVITNSFGSFSGEFQLPQGLLNGRFTINSDKDNGWVPFRMEEYKRPTFDIYLKENDKTYRLGDVVTIEGNAKSFSGVGISNSNLHYRITRQPHFLYRWVRPTPVQVAEGVIEVGDDGGFEISFKTERAFEDRNQKNVTYTYVVEAWITDTNGETQQKQTQVNIGEITGTLDIKINGKKFDKDSISSFTISAQNLNRKQIQTTGTYEIYKMKPKNPSKFDNWGDDWIKDKKITGGDFETEKTTPSALRFIFKSGNGLQPFFMVVISVYNL